MVSQPMLMLREAQIPRCVSIDTNHPNFGVNVIWSVVRDMDGVAVDIAKIDKGAYTAAVCA